MKAPALVLPGKLCGAFQTNEKLALKVKQLVQVWEKKVDGVLVHTVTLRERI
jgi:hypothetical protein